MPYISVPIYIGALYVGALYRGPMYRALYINIYLYIDCLSSENLAANPCPAPYKYLHLMAGNERSFQTRSLFAGGTLLYRALLYRALIYRALLHRVFSYRALLLRVPGGRCPRTPRIYPPGGAAASQTSSHLGARRPPGCPSSLSLHICE